MTATVISPGAFREYIRARGVKQTAIARRAGCSQAKVSALANGHRPTCPDHWATEIEKALRLPKGAVFDYTPDSYGDAA